MTLEAQGHTHQHGLIEVPLTAEEMTVPPQDIEVGAEIEHPDGSLISGLGFWEGGNRWTVRVAAPTTGRYTIRTWSRPPVPGLDGIETQVEVTPYSGNNLLYMHGPIRTVPGERWFLHADGTPFLWVADTWWFGGARRFGWPEDVQRLIRDRVDKGFSVVQIVVGFLPEVEGFDETAAGDGGFPWTEALDSINPDYFNHMDLRIKELMGQGLVPCIVGSWGAHLNLLGMDRMKTHWRELVARYAALPVVWCVAGEADYPDLGDQEVPTEQRAADVTRLRQNWSEMAEYIRQIDPYARPMSVHPCPGVGSWTSDEVFTDPTLNDFVMLHTGHWGPKSFDPSLDTLDRALERTPTAPVFNSEVCYEGILGSSWQEVQRFLFWTHVVSGAAGHTYGAQGLWAFNDGTFRGFGGGWSSMQWREAAELPGGRQVGLGRRLLEELEWWRFKPNQEWIMPHASSGHRELPYATGDGDSVRLFYFPSGAYADWSDESRFPFRDVVITDLEPDHEYELHYIDPRTGERQSPFRRDAGGDGELHLGPVAVNVLPTMEDWLLVLRRV
ncbi:MAG: DUF4038 domain-containing protein [Acidimicrobiia bacterium]